ncbi:MAG: hypothetical protein GY821_02425 [Gammaproteobacteria bacterium]|nr:hypothetical protein [Gammaproteobacteria bacterium]
MLNIYQKLPTYKHNEIFDIVATKIREQSPTNNNSGTSTYSELQEVFVNTMANNDHKRFYQLSWDLMQTFPKNIFESVVNLVTTKKSAKEKIVLDLHQIDHDQKFTLTIKIVRPFNIENISCTTNWPQLVFQLKSLFQRYRKEGGSNSATFFPPLLASNMDKINFMNSVFSHIHKLDPTCNSSNQFKLLQHICSHLAGYDKSLDSHRTTMLVRGLLRNSKASVDLGDDIKKLIVKFSEVGNPYQPKSLANRLTRRAAHEILSPSLFGIAASLLCSIMLALTDQEYSYSAILLTIALGCAIMGYNLLDTTETTNGHSCTQIAVGLISAMAVTFLNPQVQHDHVPECNSEGLPEICMSPN